MPAFGNPSKRGVGEQLQVELDLALLARQPDLGEARHLANRAGEAGVATAAGTATRDDDTRLRVREVRDELVAGVEICVPTGTASTTSSPSAPCLRAPRPFPPFVAAISRRRW